MSDDEHEVMTSILDWFGQIEEWVPGAGKWAADLLVGPIPLAYANNAYDLADQWGQLADALNAAYEDVMQAANPILENWSGDGAAQVFVEQWFAYLEGLRQTADSAAQMQRGAQNFGLEVELMKFMAALNLIMLAVSLFMLIAAAIPTGGGSLGAAPGLFATCRIALGRAASQTVGKIASIVMRIVMRVLTRLFGRISVAIAQRVAQSALPRIAAAIAERLATAMTKTFLGRLARAIAARGISKAVANRLAAQALRGLADKEIEGTLTRQATREAQYLLAKEIRNQLLRKWAGKEGQQVAESALEKLAAKQIENSLLGREFAQYVGTRIAFGAGFMGGGNLLGQFGQVLSGNRAAGDIDWAQVKDGAFQGAVFGAGMFGGVVGHTVGGALAGGGLTLGQEIYHYVDSGHKDAIDWTAVGHSAVQGGAAGVLFGGQAALEHANLSLPHTRLGSLRIGADVHVLPGDHDGFNVVATRANGREGLLLTSDGYVAFQGRDGVQHLPTEIAGRPDVASIVDQHFAGLTVDPRFATEIAPSPGDVRVDSQAARADTSAGAPARSSGGDGGGGGGGGPRQNVPGNGGLRTTETGRSSEASSRESSSLGGPQTEHPLVPDGTGDHTTGDHTTGDGAAAAASPDGPSPEGGDRPPGDGTAVRDGAGPGADRSPVGGDRTPAHQAAGQHALAEHGRAEDGSSGARQEARGGGRRSDDVASPVGPSDGLPRTGSDRVGSHLDARAGEATPPPGEHAVARTGHDAPVRHDGGDTVRESGESGPPGGPPHDPTGVRPHAAEHHGDEPVMRSAGAEVGEQATPESIRQGTVRMELHPDFPDVVAYLGEHGFRLVEDPAGPRAVIRHLYSADGKTFLGEEREVRHLDGMRYLDLEHELDHVRQLIDRFHGDLGTEAYRVRENGTRVEMQGARRILSAKYDTVVEYHVRLGEAIRLIRNDVDPALIREHLAGVDERRALMNQKIHQRDSKAQDWRREHFSDIPALERKLGELREGFAARGSVREVDPYRLVTVDGPAPEHPVAAAHEVKAVLDGELSGLVEGRDAGADDQPHRADWDPESGTFRVRYGDGLEVDVVVQVNESVPPGHTVVVRPTLETVEGGGWRQTGPAGVVLSSHLPGEAAAREPHVLDALHKGWHALHTEVGDQLHPPDAFTGASIRPRDELRAYDWSDRAYERFRSDDADVAEIAANIADIPRTEGGTPFTPAEIHQIKQHLMVEPHPIRDYDGNVEMRRFDSSPDIAEAWIRLREGHPLPEDLVLLNHELTESNYMRQHPEAEYRTAHDFANERHNWQDNIPERTGEDLDNKWGRHDDNGNSGRLPENPGDRHAGGLSLRKSGDGPPADNREIHSGGFSGRRHGGSDVRGGVHEDPAASAGTGELAGGRNVRGVEPEALRALEDPVPDVPVQSEDAVGRHQAAPAEQPEPAALTPESVRQSIAGRGGPEQLGRWAGEHLADRAGNGTLRPKTAEEITATVDRLADQAIELVRPESHRSEDLYSRTEGWDSAGEVLGRGGVRPADAGNDPGRSVASSRSGAGDEVRHTASPIGGSDFVPDGRAWHEPDVSVAELHRAALGALPADFADGRVSYVTSDGPHVRVEMIDGSVRHFLPRVGEGMRDLAETTVRSGTPEDPHIVDVNRRVAGEQLTRVWIHEITETLAIQHAAETRAEPHGLVRRAMAAIGRIFGRDDTSQPEAARVDPHVAARINERLHLQRLHDWAWGRPDEQIRLRREIAGLDRDLAALGHGVDPPRMEWRYNDWGVPHEIVHDGVIRGAHHATPAHEPEPVPHEPARHEPAPPESSFDRHWTDKPWESEGRRPSLDELIPLSDAEAARWGGEIRAEVARQIESREFGEGFRVRFDEDRGHPISADRNSVTLRFKVYGPDGSLAGHTIREFSRENDGTLYVTHSSIKLYDEAQGRGFSDGWNGFLEDWYHESGVDHIEVHAVDRGAYAWARAGYDWAPNTEHRANGVLRNLRSAVGRIDEHLDHLDRWQRGEVELDVASLLERYGADHPDQLPDRMRYERDAGRQILDRAARHSFGSEGYPTPNEISRAGADGRHGRDQVWVGKEALLGADWKGVKPISDGGVVNPHPRTDAPDGLTRPFERHDAHHSPARTNYDVLVNGSDVPLTEAAVNHVAQLMGIDLSGARIHLITDAAEVRHYDSRGISAVTPPEMGGREIHFGPAAFADAETLAATVAHEYTHVVQLREGRELGTHTMRALEDEAFASEGPALERFRQGFEGWERVREGAVLDRGGLRPEEPRRPAGFGEGSRGSDLHRGDGAGRGDRSDGEGAGSGVRDAGGPFAGTDHLGGGAHESHSDSRRPGPRDLNRPIGGRRSGGPPFGYDRFYRDPQWTSEAVAFEMRLGVHYFNDPHTLNTAREAVSHLRDVLTTLATSGVDDPAARAAIAREVEAAFFRGDEKSFNSAGQVGLGVPLDAVLREGNLRELTTAFYNAAYFNRDSPHTLAATLLGVIDRGRWDEAARAGIDVAELYDMRDQLDHSLNRAIFGRIEEMRPPSESPRFVRDAFATGNVIMRSPRGFLNMLEVVASQLGRRTRDEIEQLALAATFEHYEQLGAPLGRFERAFVESILGGSLEPGTKLPWREGVVWHDTGGSIWARGVGRDGYPVLDGISATTTRMLTGAKMIGIHGPEATHFLHVLMGWMLPARDHSLFELLRGGSMAGVEPLAVHPRSVRPTAIDLYRNLPGVDMHTIRTEVAEGGLLPHEARYLDHALDPNGFAETQHRVRAIVDRLRPQLESGRVTDADLAHWLEQNGIDPHDPVAVRDFAEHLTGPHMISMAVYSLYSHQLINTVITAHLMTREVSESAVRLVHDRAIANLVDPYLHKLAEGETPSQLPFGLRSVLHEGAGLLDSSSPLRPSAQRWVEAIQARQAAREEAQRFLGAGDEVSARRAKVEADRAGSDAAAARRQIARDLGEVAPRLFDEVRWHADMVYDALMRLPTVGTPQEPVIAYRGAAANLASAVTYGSRILPGGKAVSVLSLSRDPQVAVGFMTRNSASDDKVLAVYRLTGVNARDISVFSAFPRQQEIVLPPGARTLRVGDPILEQQVRDQLPPDWRDRCRIIVLEERG